MGIVKYFAALIICLACSVSALAQTPLIFKFGDETVKVTQADVQDAALRIGIKKQLFLNLTLKEQANQNMTKTASEQAGKKLTILFGKNTLAKDILIPESIEDFNDMQIALPKNKNLAYQILEALSQITPPAPEPAKEAEAKQ
ncbi:hypothetical protein KCM76_10440 [Zooshikella marina]|uniref:Uncharacterized protein n=1 Tax=Zooshikella ganghwensis TaxID=202772 RepID=A0A4P9VJ38_9GAMM|nr:hypothetical protein [Zooshikella ganghwensis]MBU2706407.1 hypothetical protein [Zooshikella ganghwensis]RDH42227.1 hypothetical protein B9G39_01505 [Zooshikella ganghwensis]